MSHSYRQMEEAVARKVRETMELAEARKKALTPNKDDKQTETAPRKTFAVGKEELDRIDASIRIVEDVANKLTETRSIMGINVLDTGKAAIAKRRFLTEDIQNLTDNKKTNLPADGSNPQEIGFEHIRRNDQKQLKHLAEGALSLAQNGAWNIANRDYDVHADKRQLAEEALNLAQSAPWNIDNVYEGGTADERELPVGELNLALAEGALSLAQNAARNISNRAYGDERESTESEQNSWNTDNKLHETDANKRDLAEAALILAQSGAWNMANKAHDVDKRQLAEGALNLAQSATWNVDKVYESDKVENREFPVGELHLAQGALSLAQNAGRNIDNRSEVGDRQEHTEGELNLSLAEGALNLAKNAAWNIDNNADKRVLAEGALNLAQNAAWNIDNATGEAQNASRDFDEVQTAEVNRREFAEGALNLAQHAARSIGSDPDNEGKAKRRQLSKEANSLDGSFESTIAPWNQEKPQLGFGHILAFKETIEQDKELKWVLDDINKKSLAEYDKKIVSAAKADVRKVSKDLQNIEIEVDSNNYDAEQVDESKRKLAEGALGLAQAGARSIDEDDIGVVKIRELGEGALSLAQSAAMKEALENVGSLEDAFFKKITDQQKQTLQLGFEQLENTDDSRLEEAGRTVNISFHSKTNK